MNARELPGASNATSGEAYLVLQQHFDDIARLVSDFIWELDGDLILRSISPRLHEVTGYLPHEWVGHRLEDFGAFVDEEGCEETIDWHKPFREKWYRVESRDGVFCTFLLSGIPYYHIATGQFQGVHGVARDVTDILSVEEKLRHSKEVAEKSNHAKSDFLASMSHELRTPLNGILGFAQLLQLNPGREPLSDAQQGYAQNIMNSGRHLLDLIDQVLELSKIEAGRYDVTIADVPLAALMDECLVLVQPMADKNGVLVQNLIASEDVIAVRADVTRLKQVVLNLLSNAVKYNRPDGAVTVTSLLGDGIVKIDIADTGIGIAHTDQEKLFMPFERLGHEGSNIEGTGIGLTITRELLHLMDGDIAFDSTVGEGSVFSITLPLAEGVATHAPLPDIAPAPAKLDAMTDERTVLYVEDNPANMALMEQIIAMLANVNMICAHNAEIGIAMAEAKRPDVILMDINLPGMNGIEALKALSQIEATKDIPVLAISAAAMPHEVKAGLKAGFQAYLTKPLDVTSLIKTLNALLNEDDSHTEEQARAG